MSEMCPNCHVVPISAWKRIIAVKPFGIRCRNCNSLLRVDEKGWLNLAAQSVGILAFLFVTLEVATKLRTGFFLSGVFGLIVFVGISLIPAFFGNLEVVGKKRKAG
jgi:phage FluMu protein Com